MSNWIKIRTSLVDDPRVMSMADSLKVSDVEIIGALVTFWAWADKHTEDGTVRNLSRSRVDKVGTIDGLSAELIRIGWAEVDESTQEFILINFAEHNGNSAKKRAVDAKRKANSRAATNKKPSKSESCPKIVTHESGQKSELDKNRIDKNREDKNKESGSSSSDQPSFDQVLNFSKSVTGATPEMAEDYHNSRVAVGWIMRDRLIQNWKADFSHYVSRWLRNEHNRAHSPQKDSKTSPRQSSKQIERYTAPPPLTDEQIAKNLEAIKEIRGDMKK